MKQDLTESGGGRFAKFNVGKKLNKKDPCSLIKTSLRLHRRSNFYKIKINRDKPLFMEEKWHF